MYSVTQRIKTIKQPRGGYIKPSLFTVNKIEDGIQLNENENIHPVIMGLVVDYLSRTLMGAKIEDAFRISCIGAYTAEKIFNQKGALRDACTLLAGIQGLDDNSVINACKLVTYDVWFRHPHGAATAKGPKETNPDAETIQNIQSMVMRSFDFIDTYGPVIKDGFTFEPNGYTETVSSGDGDFLTEDTLWDFKVSKARPTNKHTLQLLMYWIMGQHSGQEIFKNIKNLGIFNPRLNEVYLLCLDSVDREIIAKVEADVICY